MRERLVQLSLLLLVLHSVFISAIQTVDQGPYDSEYKAICSSSVQWYHPAAVAACDDEGNGWGLASIPTPAAQSAIEVIGLASPVNGRPMWIGASDADVESLWFWTHGRLAGKLFTYGLYPTASCQTITYQPFSTVSYFAFCPWAGNNPSNSYGGQEEDCGEYQSTKGINDLVCEGYVEERKIYCALCERSPCSIGADCHPQNSADVGGYYPYCTCVCKPSYWGTKCEKQTRVDQGPYYSLYAYHCPSGTMNFNSASAACMTLGTGWQIATIPSSAAATALTTNAPSQSSASWVGVRDPSGNGAWQYSAGRYNGRIYSYNSSCQTSLFDPFGINKTIVNHCRWGLGQPAATAGNQCSQRIPAGTLSNANCASTLSCVLCEASPCEMGIDCHPLNTLSMTGGYFPNCVCVCKPGTGGNQCRYPHASPTQTQSASSSSSLSSSLLMTVTATHALTSTATLSTITRGSRTHSGLSLTPSHTSPQSATESETKTMTLSVSRSESSSLTLSTITQATHTLSAPSPSFSKTASTTASSSSSLSTTRSYTQSSSQTLSCKDYQDLSDNNTCEVFRPLPHYSESLNFSLDALALTASFLYGASSECTAIMVPFDLWTGREGATHVLRIVAIDSRLPIHGVPPKPIVRDSSQIKIIYTVPTPVQVAIQYTDEGEVANALMRGNPYAGSNQSLDFLAGEVSLRYEGRATLNKARYKLDLKTWSRCPISMPGVFSVTLQQAERLYPVNASEAIDIVCAVVSVFGALSVTPTAVAQFAAVHAVRRMSRCLAIDPDDEDTTDFDQYSGGALNPFGIALGQDGARRYLRGTLLMSLIYFLALSVLMFAFTTISSQMAARLTPTRQLPLHAGYPSALVAVGAFVMEGLITAGTTLGMLGKEAGDWIGGWVAVLLCSLFVTHIVVVTTISFPRGLFAAAHAQSSKRISWLDWALKPTHSGWIVKESPSDIEMEEKTEDVANTWLFRYEGYVADVSLSWYCGFEQVVVLLVCFVASLPIGEPNFCAARGAIVIFFIGAQAAVVVFKRPMVHRWRWLVMSLALLLQVVSAALSSANSFLQLQEVELAMDIIGLIVLILISLCSAIDLVMQFKEFSVSLRAYLALYQGKTVYDAPSENIMFPLMALEEEDERELAVLPPRTSFSLGGSSTATSSRRSSNSKSGWFPRRINERDVVHEILCSFAVFENEQILLKDETTHGAMPTDSSEDDNFLSSFTREKITISNTL